MDAPKASAASLAIVISIMSGLVSISAFTIGLVGAMRGSEVTLFPFDAVSFYRLPERGRLAISLRTEFANTAGSDYPDVLAQQWVTISEDGAPFACFGQGGDALLIEAPLQAAAATQAQAASTAPVAQAPPCSSGSRCYAIAPDANLELIDTPVRRSLPSGQITSAEQYFDARSITPTHPCAAAFRTLGRPTVAQLTATDRARHLVVEYHAQTLGDGAFTARCDINLQTGQLNKLSAEGRSTFACATTAIQRQRRSFLSVLGLSGRPPGA